jgi:predicted GIY-YIG superfamily endonuclease
MDGIVEIYMGEVGSFLENWNEVVPETVYSEFEPPELSRFVDVALAMKGGVYVLLKGVVIVYVGQAECLMARINGHRNGNKIRFDGVKIFPCNHKGRRVAMERELIKKYNPKGNVKHTTPVRPINLIPLRELMKLPSTNVIPFNRRF